MNFNIPEETIELKKTIRRFVDEILIPAEREVDEHDKVPDRIMAEMRRLGLFGMVIPADYDGLGLNCLATSVVLEELGRAHSAFRGVLITNNGIGAKAIINRGTEEQKKKFLPKLASGEWIGAFALTEPEAGSDASAVKTTAEKKGDHYVLNGIKHFITNGPEAHVLTVMAMTDPDAGHKGMSAFVIETDTPGFRVQRIMKTMGPGGYHQGELVFENCEIPAENIIGEPGQGLKIALETLNHGRVVLGAAAVGLAQRLLDETKAWANSRVQFGRPIAKFQAIQFMLADMAVDIHLSRLAAYNAAWLVDQHQDARFEASAAKLFSTEAVGRVADKAVQIFGGMGYMQDLPIERMYREARLLRIVEGTSEIQRIIISREILKT
ncbi:MAG: acyl-CoA dehydrogenase [Deltaproteobacteria bacterium]|nr:acyl-CoA dehydrogenase [Deltaproteobacteria bacterium]